MQKHSAKEQLPGNGHAIADYLNGLTQMFTNTKWFGKPRAGEAASEPVREIVPATMPPRRGVKSRHKVPVVDELPAENEVSTTLDFETLGKGGLLQIFTRNTTYSFRMLNHREAILSTDRENRPEGLVQLRGCSYGAGGSISPDRVFCGGNLEFSANATRQVHITSEIHALKWQPPVEVPAAA
jgi:hypothetical protein